MEVKPKFNIIFFNIKSFSKSYRELKDITIAHNLIHKWKIAFICEDLKKFLLTSLLFSVPCDKITSSSRVNNILWFDENLSLG